MRLGQMLSVSGCPPQATTRAALHDMKPGRAFDLVLGSSSPLRQQDQRAGLNIIAVARPSRVGISPPCTVFSAVLLLGNSLVVEAVGPAYLSKLTEAIKLLRGL